MSHVLFYDSACPSAYASESLLASGIRIGGAEATVVRVAEELSQHHRVSVAQHNRTRREKTEGRELFWMPEDEATGLDPDAIVIVRRVGDIPRLRRLYPKVPIFVWFHDWFDEAPRGPLRMDWVVWQAKTEARLLLLASYRAVAVGVSRTHEENIRRALAKARFLGGLERRVRVEHVYNPIADDLGPSDARAYDPDKLIFFSAPWKGLDLVLVAFAEVRKHLPELTLHVASPGYQQSERLAGLSTEKVTFMGSLPHAEVIREVRSSMCVFYPANRIPETFGLVFAESNAVGTPVLTHPFGAAPELLTPEQLVDAHDTSAIVERLRSWKNGARPLVRAKEEFRLKRVARAWEALLFR
jgi:glycosyltransferase involved in cell wall biosynthesis